MGGNESEELAGGCLWRFFGCFYVEEQGLERVTVFCRTRG